jgi:hypothetical protein
MGVGLSSGLYIIDDWLHHTFVSNLGRTKINICHFENAYCFASIFNFYGNMVGDTSKRQRYTTVYLFSVLEVYLRFSFATINIRVAQLLLEINSETKSIFA